MNGDKNSTLHYFFTLSQQHSMLWVGTGLMPSNSKAATRNDVNYVGGSRPDDRFARRTPRPTRLRRATSPPPGLRHAPADVAAKVFG